MCRKLECTDAQKTELRAIFSEMREDAKGDREAIERLRDQMAAEFAKDVPDEKKLQQLQTQISVHHAELASRRLDAMLEVHGALDASQREKLIEIMKDKRDRHRGKKGRRGPKKSSPE